MNGWCLEVFTPFISVTLVRFNCASGIVNRCIMQLTIEATLVEELQAERKGQSGPQPRRSDYCSRRLNPVYLEKWSFRAWASSLEIVVMCHCYCWCEKLRLQSGSILQSVWEYVWKVWGSQISCLSPHHDTDHSDVNKRLWGHRLSLIVTHQTTTMHQPTKCPLYDPSFFEYYKAFGLLGT